MKCPKSLVIPALSLAFLMGCEQPLGDDAGRSGDGAVSLQEAPIPVVTNETRLPDLLDCVREEGGLLLAAHRGGPVPGYPENALETLDNTLSSAAFVMEVDVAESADGVPFLMHDDTLGRTTTGTGRVSETEWAEISGLDLVDAEGTVTAFSPPSLEAALDWAVAEDAILELDRKDSASFRTIIETVRAAGAESNVVMITYSDSEAATVARLAPDLVMTASVGGPDHRAALEAAGVDPDRLIAWTGTSGPSPEKWQALAEQDIESAFGTLGRPGQRLDDQYWADGDPSEYSEMARNGLTLLATDTPHRLVRADGWIGTAQDIARKECMRGFAG